MKLRFLAVAGPADARLRLERAARLGAADGLVKVHRGATLSVWTLPATPSLRSEREDLVLVGLLFERASGGRVAALEPDAADPERFVRDYWGACVLFHDQGDSHSVLRDPSGAIPVYFGRAGDLDLYASDADMLQRAWPGPLQPDLDFIRHWLAFPFLRSSRTGAAGVRELLPGASRRSSNGGEQLVQAWSPFGFAQPDAAISSFSEAATRLREEALRTIPRLAPEGETVTLQLSGGLDSSIVAAALHHAGTAFRAVNFATTSADGDERRYAREVAHYCGVELVELVEEHAAPSLELAVTDPLRPPPNPLLQPVHRAARLHFAIAGSGLVLDGAGGDNVFAYLNSPVPALDALRRKGVAAGMATLQDVAALHDCTFWTAARLAFRKARRGIPTGWRADHSFLAEGAAAAGAEAHLWLSPPDNILAGSTDHVRMIVGIHHFLFDPWPGAPAVLHPLLAQPLVELCLRIPTWLWVQGGRDRAVAREAFAGLLPDRILQRRGKGRLETMFVKGYRSVRDQLKPFLLDGELAARGIIDRDAVQDYLVSDRSPDGRHIRLLEIAAAEQWLRSFGR